MAYFGKGKKIDLVKLAEVLEIPITSDETILQIKNTIVSHEDYDEEFVKTLYESLVKERLENEAKQEQLRLEELNRQERVKREEAKFEAEKLMQEKELELKFEAEKVIKEKELELKEKELTQRFELEKLKVEKGKVDVETPATESNWQSTKLNLNLKKLIPDFDPQKTDISLYLVLFERQVKRAKIDPQFWVAHLISLLPIEVVQVVAREPETLSEDYSHIKKVLLDRYKLSPEIFRQKFVQHQKRNEITWKDFSYELNNYLEEWLRGLKVDSFENLKQLLVVNELKKRAKVEMRTHFLDKWANLKTTDEAIRLFDDYDNIRTPNKAREFTGDKFRASIVGNTSKENRARDCLPGSKNKTAVYKDKERENAFERRVPPRCYLCNSEQHLRYACPKLQKNKPSGSLNNIQDVKSTTLLDSYTFNGSVNGQETRILRDSGASLDVCARRFVSPKDFSGEKIWIKQPLSLELVCLPLATVQISGEFGEIQTKAAICGNHLDQDRYILGNKTAELIKERNGYDFFRVGHLNAVETRSQTQRKKKEISEFQTPESQRSAEPLREENEEASFNVSSDEGEPISLPNAEAEIPELKLLEVNRENLIKAQLLDESLKDLVRQASHSDPAKVNKTYSFENGVLVKKREDRFGNINNLVVVPQKLRGKVKALCHEGTSAHLGSTKSKDKLNRYFYWPNCYKEMDEFVQSCDSCQRAGRPNDKKKAPMKLVPIIEEVFSRINIDICGPLPLTSNGNKYLLTAICLASKFPEAIPLPDINSVRVTDALLQIFSHIGYPREIQTDQGTVFTSALTTEFFDKLGIKVSRSSPSHPQSNSVERLHKTLKRLIRALCIDSGPDWDKHLSAILLALRTVTHETTGFTPSELVYGKNLRTPETLLMEHWLEPEKENDLVTEHVFKLINRLKQCREIATNRMEEIQIKRKKWYDKNAVKREFKEGDLVLILATSRPNKLSVQWTGPGTVRNKISETNYVVEIPGKKDRTQIYHVNMLKPYYLRPEHINLLVTEEMSLNSEDDLDISYLERNATVFDFREIMETSKLEKNLKEFQIEQLRELLNQFMKCFSNEPGLTNLVEHDITLICDKPVRSKPYRTSQRQTDILKTEIQKMLKLGIVEVGESDYVSPVVLIESPGKDPRLCIDYRKLNEITRTEYFPLPNPEERVEKVASAKYITVLDLSKGYWQIGLSKNAQRYAAFCTTFGCYRILRMGFGLKNAAYYFSKLMSDLLYDYEEFALPYLDDVAVFSETWESHLNHLRAVLDRLKKANLTIKLAKCRFAQKQVKYLGHLVGNGIRSPAEAKIKCVKDFPAPKTKTQIRKFMGLCSYYGHYIEGFSVISAPLSDTLKGKTKKGAIIWTEECEKAFNMLKEKLTSNPILHAPDFNREFIVQTDASNVGAGVVLSQINDKGEEHPVLYLSKKFSDVEKRYSTTEKECASIIFAVKKLHYYLDGRKFKIVTDHNPLCWLRSNASSNPRLMRWALALQPYEFEVIHRSGKDNKNADCLSRSPVGL